MPDRTYEDGLRDANISALRDIAAAHKERLDHHSGRLRLLERIIWGSAGIFVLISLWPKLASFWGAVGGSGVQ